MVISAGDVRKENSLQDERKTYYVICSLYGKKYRRYNIRSELIKTLKCENKVRSKKLLEKIEKNT